MLEPILQTYQPIREEKVVVEIHTSGLEMYTLGVNDGPMRMPDPTPIGGAGSGFGILRNEYGPYGIGRERTIDEEIVPGLKELKILTNIHIPLDDKK